MGSSDFLLSLAWVIIVTQLITDFPCITAILFFMFFVPNWGFESRTVVSTTMVINLLLHFPVIMYAVMFVFLCCWSMDRCMPQHERHKPESTPAWNLAVNPDGRVLVARGLPVCDEV